MSRKDLNVEDRANDLLRRMTVVEKAQQVSGAMPTAFFGPDGFDADAAARSIGDGIGHISNGAMSAPGPIELAAMSNGIQHFLVERTRLGIPAIIHAESLNGFVAAGYTSFPTAIGLAATWDPASVTAMTEIIRVQMRSVGVLQALSPVMDIARDPRWGRVHETYGEDPYLVSAMSVAFTQGLQGDDLSTGILATGKHFLGYAMTEAGQNMAATHLGPRELYDVYATPFEAALRLAGLGSVMNSYSEIDGVPAGASSALLTELLRGRMGFTGSVVSDYSTVEWLHTRQGTADSLEEAGRQAITAGLDVELPVAVGYGRRLAESVESGELSEAILDIAVRRVLVDKIRLGLFDNPYVAEDPIVISDAAGSGKKLSSELARKSLTLVKNNGILPLRQPKSVAVIGPNSQSAMVNFAAYTYPASLDMMKGLFTGESRMAGQEAMMDASAVEGPAAEAMIAQLLAVDSEQIAQHAYGAAPLADAISRAFPAAAVIPATGVNIHPDDPQDIGAAVAAAETADVVVLALGGRGGWFGTRITEGEGTDAARIELPDHQIDLVRAVAATGKPLVAVFYQGRPYAFSDIDDLLSAALIAYYPGPEGPAAIADALSGEFNPGGRLPYTIPRSTGQIPIYLGQKHGSGPRRGSGDMFRSYIDMPVTPLYPFGHGLSYTRFAYGDMELDRSDMSTDGGSVEVSVAVTNTGALAGDDVVQFYVSDHARGVTRPALQLAGFARITLEPGQGAVVTCRISAAQLGYSGVDGRFVIEPGPLEISVGPSSGYLSATATCLLVGETVNLEGRRKYLSDVDVDHV